MSYVQRASIAERVCRPPTFARSELLVSELSKASRQGRVLIVEDDQQNARLLKRILTADGFDADIVHDGTAALSAIAANPPDLVLLDWMLPGLTGLEVCQRLKSERATRLIPVIILTGLDARESRLAGIRAGADDFLTKPFDRGELQARVRSLARLKHYTDELDSAESIIRSLALTIEARDECTDGHCQRLAGYATSLGAALGLAPDVQSALEKGGFLHDVGKIGIPDAVLLKPSKLTPEETAIMRQHTIIGERLCGDLRSLAAVRPIVRSHHERLDGSGYPDGLRGDAVPLTAQIIGIVDTFDAVTTTRPYRPARSFAQGCAELAEDARQGRFDQELVDAFARLINL
jgi:putative two-component system response regulator